ncbi:GNAT family N-acetyltransferase [Dactylosporangium sp. AC04546]|uniref:GNAT family N-acetyltransferase n=1 Tax=Dactylosporangium sp. AC04546 TaxID=2862460 RepID=UPI001EDFD258|nr:GNAT family N-acetyltransferase [Dactylosporangium sp. AC04546]WVK87546.1 GNAT family N-acetyltransferase [Dactylosporangium sp. AC04546]
MEAETAEAEFMYQLVVTAPAGMREARGMAAERIGGGVALAMRDDPARYWNKALGFPGPTGPDLLTDLAGFYRRHGVAMAVLQPAPAALPTGWPGLCAEFGIAAADTWLQLACPIGAATTAPPATAAGVEIGPVAPGDAEEWGAVVAGAFGMSPGIYGPMLAAVVGHPAFRPFAARVDGRIAGGGSLFVHAGVGVLNSTAVDRRYRNRGIQTALIRTRIAAARDLGCRIVAAQVVEPVPGTVNPSLENLGRAGLRRLYRRRNWVWRAAAHG